jgi:hypothetical protein
MAGLISKFTGRHIALLKRFFLIGIALAMLVATLDADAQSAGRTTDIGHQVKAAYLYKFTNFVEWPADAFAGTDSPLVIGVVGADVLADELENAVAGHVAGGRKLVVRKLRRNDPISDVHVLFIGNVDKSRLREIYAEVKQRPILTVTDSDEMHAMGSMINFVVTGDRLRFEVALKPVAASRLKISALMLTAAYRVTKGDS